MTYYAKRNLMLGELNSIFSPEDEAAAAKLNDISFPDGGSPTGVIQRKPNESVADYLKRIG